MDRFHYAGNSIVTGTSIAHALIDYAQALAQAGAAIAVTVPTIGDDGSPGRSEILIGPSSQLMSDHEDSDYEDPVDDTLVTGMHLEATRLRNQGVATHSAQISEPDHSREWSDYEF